MTWPAFPGFHLPTNRLCCQKRTNCIPITDLAEIFWGVINGSRCVDDAGNAAEDVEFPKHLRDLTDRIVQGICVRNIYKLKNHVLGFRGKR